MKVSPYARRPAEASMLVNLPRLVTVHYTKPPAPSGTGDIHKIHAESFRGADSLRHVPEEARAMVNDAWAETPDRSDRL
jgi:hypothetical protein